MITGYSVEHLRVERLQPQHVVDGHITRFSGHFQRVGARGTDGGNCYRRIVGFQQHTPFAHGQDFRFPFPLRVIAAASGITDSHRAVYRHRCVHETTQVILVERRGYGHIRDNTQIGEVKKTVMRYTVGTDHTRTVNHERYRQPLDGHIMYDIVVCTLQERGVDGHKRLLAGGCHSAGKRYSMTL